MKSYQGGSNWKRGSMAAQWDNEQQVYNAVPYRYPELSNRNGKNHIRGKPTVKKLLGLQKKSSDDHGQTAATKSSVEMLSSDSGIADNTPVNICSDMEDVTPSKRKKKKKEKKNKVSESFDNDQHEEAKCVETNGHNVETENDERSNECEEPQCKKKKSKKNKLKAKVEEEVCEDKNKAVSTEENAKVHSDEKKCKSSDELVQVTAKTKKSKKVKVINGETGKHAVEEEEPVPEEGSKTSLKQKAKAKMAEEFSSLEIEEADNTACIGVNLKLKKKKSKKSKKGSEVIIVENEEPTLEWNSSPQKKKKRKDRKLEEANEEESPIQAIEEVTENPAKKKKGKKRKHQEIDNGETQPEDLNGKTKKKKKEDVAFNEAVCDKEQDGDEEIFGKKKKKKQKTTNSSTDEPIKDKTSSVETVSGEPDEPQDNAKLRKKKNKTRKSSTNCIMNVTTDNSPDDGGVNNLSVNENKNATESVSTGQWSSVSLGNDSRTQKFLRLMGGHKQSAPADKSHSHNVAMDASKEKEVNSALETQFTKAMELVVNKTKGKGIGYQAPPGAGKKFYIDANQSKSVKFDDE